MQKKWTDIYADDAEARTRLFVRAKTKESHAGECICATFVVVGGGPAPAATPQPSSSSHESNSGADADDHSGPDTKSPGSPLGAFCADVNVEAGAFFKPEVIGQATFITQLGNVAKDWIHFQKERRLYHTSSSFRWRRLVLQESLVFIDALATKIRRKMDEISKITLNPLQLLTSVGSVSITMKLCTLSELAGNLGVLQDRLEDAALRLQHLNTQIRASLAAS